MKRMIYFCLISLFLTGGLTATAFNGAIKFDFSLQTIDITYPASDSSETDQLDTLHLSTLGISFYTDLTDNIQMGLKAGYSFKKFDTSISFQQLPLSVSMENQNFNSMYFGLLMDYRILYHKTVSLKLKADCSYYKMFKIQKTVSLPIVEGEITLTNSFLTGNLQLLCEWDGIEGLVFYAGPTLNILTGRNKAIETIGELEGEELRKFSQSKIAGVTVGSILELWEDFSIHARAQFLSHFMVGGGIKYEF